MHFSKHIIPFILVALARINVYAQEDLRLWSQGPLSWKDFSLRDSTPTVSRLVYILNMRQGRQRYGDTIALRYLAHAAMDPQRSYFNRRFLKEEYLRYNQIIFDLTELYRRKLQYALDRLDKPYEAWTLWYRYKNELDDQVTKFKEESWFGQRPEVMDEWEIRIRNQMEQYPGGPPAYTLDRWTFTERLGITYLWPAGTLGRYLKPGGGVEVDLGLSYGNYQFMMLASATGNRVRAAYDTTWTEAKHAGFVAIELMAGYKQTSGKHTLTPMAGLGYWYLSANKDQSDENAFSYQRWSPGLGLAYVYRHRSFLRFIPQYKDRQYTDWSFGLQFTVSKPAFTPDLKGYLFRLGLFWEMNFRSLHLPE